MRFASLKYLCCICIIAAALGTLSNTCQAQAVSPYQFAVTKRVSVNQERTAVAEMVFRTDDALNILRGERGKSLMLVAAFLSVVAFAMRLTYAGKSLLASTGLLCALNYPFFFLTVFIPASILKLRQWRREDDLVLFRKSTSALDNVSVEIRESKSGKKNSIGANDIASLIERANRSSRPLPRISRPL